MKINIFWIIQYIYNIRIDRKHKILLLKHIIFRTNLYKKMNKVKGVREKVLRVDLFRIFI